MTKASCGCLVHYPPPSAGAETSRAQRTSGGSTTEHEGWRGCRQTTAQLSTWPPPPPIPQPLSPSPTWRPLKGAHVVVPTQEPTLRSLGRQRRSTQQRTGMDEAPTQALPSLGVPAPPPLSHHTPISLPAPSGRHVASLGARGKGDGWMTAWGTTTTRSLPPELTARPPPPFPSPPLPRLPPFPPPSHCPRRHAHGAQQLRRWEEEEGKKPLCNFATLGGSPRSQSPPAPLSSPPPPPQHSPAEV